MTDIVQIPASILPRGYYAAQVAEQGHIPGILSGAALRGAAKRYGAWYASMRGRVEHALQPHGIYSGYACINSRRCRVWLRGTAPVRIELI